MTSNPTPDSARPASSSTPQPSSSTRDTVSRSDGSAPPGTAPAGSMGAGASTSVVGRLIGVFVRPRATFAEICRGRHLLEAVLWTTLGNTLLVASLLEREDGFHAEGLAAVRKLVPLAAQSTLAVCLAWAVASIIASRSLRAVRSEVSSRTVLTVALFALLPTWLVTDLATRIRDLSLEARILAATVEVAGACWFAALCWLGLRERAPRTRWGPSAAVFPLVALYTALGLWAWLLAPPSPPAAQRWSWYESADIRVAWVPGGSTVELDDIDRIAKGCREELRRVRGLLGLPARRGERIDLYLFPDERAHDELEPGRETTGFCYAELNAVTAVQAPWRELAGTVAHELSHLVTYRDVCPRLPAAIDEGIAVWVEDTLSKEDRWTATHEEPYVTSWLAMRALLEDELFHTEDADRLADHYSHAAAFVAELVDEAGFARLALVCREFRARYRTEGLWRDAADVFAEAFREVWGETIDERERRWKRAAFLEDATPGGSISRDRATRDGGR